MQLAKPRVVAMAVSTLIIMLMISFQLSLFFMAKKSVNVCVCCYPSCANAAIAMRKRRNRRALAAQSPGVSGVAARPQWRDHAAFDHWSPDGSATAALLSGIGSDDMP